MLRRASEGDDIPSRPSVHLLNGAQELHWHPTTILRIFNGRPTFVYVPYYLVSASWLLMPPLHFPDAPWIAGQHNPRLQTFRLVAIVET